MLFICNFVIISCRRPSLITKATFSNDGTYIPTLLKARPQALLIDTANALVIGNRLMNTLSL